MRPRGFWLVQAGYAGLLLGLGTVLKLPPRLALPLLDFWVLSNLVSAVPPTAGRACAVAVLLGVLALAAVPYGYKTCHRARCWPQEQQTNFAAREQLTQLVHSRRCRN